MIALRTIMACFLFLAMCYVLAATRMNDNQTDAAILGIRF